MALTLNQLLTAPTVDDWRAMLLNALKGLGIVVKAGAGVGAVGSGTGSISLSGTPLTAYTKIIINIVTAGELGTAQFQYSLNGGLTYSGTILVPAAPGNYTLSTTGVVVTFVSGPTGAGTSFVLNDTFSFALNIPSLPVTSWPPSSGYRQLVEIEAQALSQLSAQQAGLAAGGFTTSATGSWADLVGVQFYGLTRFPPSITIGQVTLIDANNAGPFTITAGAMWFAATDGHRYFNTSSGTLPKNGTLNLTISAESPGATFNAPGIGQITTIVAGTLPGVTVNNPDIGTGTWITTQGSDAESDSAYMLRCQQRWPGLGTGATAEVFKLWATSAEAAAGHSTTITRVKAVADASVSGQVDIYLAGASGPSGGGAITDAQTYITPRLSLTSTALIQAAASVAITIAGDMKYKQAYVTLGAITAAVSEVLTEYFSTLDIGGGSPSIKVDYAVILAELVDAGEVILASRELHVVDSVVGYTLNGGTSDITLTLGQVAVFVNNLTFTGV